LWSYRTSVKTSTGFTPFQMVYGLKVVLPIECEITSLKLVVEFLPNTYPEEEHLLYLTHLDETHCNAAMANEAHKKRVKVQFNKTVKPKAFSEGYLVQVYDQRHDDLGVGKFQCIWLGMYIVKRELQKGSYELDDFEGIPLAKPRNGLYIKIYYA